MSRRINRVEEACKEQLSDIIQREVKDPRIGFVTITEVRLTADLRHAKVFVSILGSDEEVEKTLLGLESAKGYLRGKLGKHLRIKYLPEIEIIRERTAEEALKISKVMESIDETLEGEDVD